MEPDSTIHNIPSEILMQILPYLPVISLLRFRSVSKEWESVIDNPDFASLHLSHYPSNVMENHLLVLDKGKEPLTLEKSAIRFGYCCMTESYQQTVKCDFQEPLTDNDEFWAFTKVVGAIDGLLLVHRNALARTHIHQNADSDIFLWNPSIRRRLNIPPPPTEPWLMSDLYLGYDPSTDDYKVVNSIYSRCSIVIEIFPLKSRSWRKGRGEASSEYVKPLYNQYSVDRVSIGGSVHWVEEYFYSLGFDEYVRLFISFNMISETRSSVQLPDVPSESQATAVVVAGSITGLLTLDNGVADIWVLERDGLWSKYYTLDTQVLSMNYITYLRDGRLVWGGDSGKIYAYDTRTAKLSFVTKSLQNPSYIGVYVESLLLLGRQEVKM